MTRKVGEGVSASLVVLVTLDGGCKGSKEEKFVMIGRKGRTLVGIVVLSCVVVGSFALTRERGLAQGNVFTKGDVFVAVGNGRVQWRRPDGTLVATLDTTRGGFTTGMAFDAQGRLYVTDFSANSVSRFDTSGNLLGTFGSGYSTPEMIVFDLAGNAYVGNLGGFIRKFDSDGNFLQQFNSGQVDFMDLDADQRTMLFTQEGNRILRYDVVSDTPLSDFATGLGGRAFALRIRPNGEVLLANGNNILRLDANGSIIQTYDQPGENNWFALNLDPDGTSFWSADFGTANVYRIDIATGNVLRTFNTGTGGNTVFGLAVFGEITVGGGGGGGGQVEGPDLTGSWVNGITQKCFRTGSRKRCQLRGKLRVQNIGTKVALSSVVKYYSSTDNTFSQDDTYLGQGVVGLLRPQQATTISFNITLPADTDLSGKFIIAVIDSTAVVQESNEGNNQAVTGPVGGEGS